MRIFLAGSVTDRGPDLVANGLWVGKKLAERQAQKRAPEDTLYIYVCVLYRGLIYRLTEMPVLTPRIIALTSLVLPAVGH